MFEDADHAVLFALFDENHDGKLDIEEFGQMLKEIGVTEFFTASKVDKFIEGQFGNADTNGDKKVVFHEFVRYFPDLLEYAKLQRIRVRRPDRYEDPELMEYAESQKETLNAQRKRTRGRRPRTPEDEEEGAADLHAEGTCPRQHQAGKPVQGLDEDGRLMLEQIAASMVTAREQKKLLESQLAAVRLQEKDAAQKALESAAQAERELADLRRSLMHAQAARRDKQRAAEATLQQVLLQVRAINKKDLKEMKKMVAPPRIVQRALEALCIALDCGALNMPMILSVMTCATLSR
ncbi:hypothetical protein CYMTET_13650 [Cymbomonas tetramitiformis]|uniref:EF-hand domain-containing protein n=1 Tax=Cymbomonas tetramitiformis TaxID=36881 RepID=A0AAE0GI04_9CHLO|nr:hypothetical protein CYMTET_13650 [Cymbomonas tetramitiformis]